MTTSTSELSSIIEQSIREELLKQSTGNASMEAEIKEKTPPVPEPTYAAREINKKQPTASKLLKSKLKHDFNVTVLDVASIPPEVIGFIPELDLTYTPQVEEAEAILRGWEFGDKSLIVGPTGSGKSSLVKYCCALTNRPMIRINMTGDIESSSIFGQLTVQDASTVWTDGAATEAVKYGAVLVIDEWEVTPPEIMFGFQNLFEDKGYLFLKEKPGTSVDKMTIPHKDFRVCCLGNTLGQGDESGNYAGTNVQNSATLDRFQTTVILDYLSEKHETEVLKNAIPELLDKDIKRMIQVAKLVRTAQRQSTINLTMSPRTLLNWGRKIVFFKGDVRTAFSLAFLNKLRDSDKKVVTEMFNKTFGVK